MDDQTVRTICYLSRLRLDDEKSKKILSDLDAIIGMIDSLSSTNTKNISVNIRILLKNVKTIANNKDIISDKSFETNDVETKNRKTKSKTSEAKKNLILNIKT